MEKDIELITFICPTRKRPGNVKRLIDSAVSNFSGNGELEFLFYVDIDDLETSRFISSIYNSYGKNVSIKHVLRERIIMSEMSNILARSAKDGILFFCGDDIVVETLNWDISVREQFEKYRDRILLVYGDDGIMHESLATHFFLHTNWIKTLGYMVPPIFPGDWVDNYVTSVSDDLGRKVYLENLRLTHMHPTAGKAKMDQVYADKYMRDIKANPQKLFNESKPIRNSDVEKLRRFINETT